MACIVLAAGKGTRMHSARPKALHKIGGRSLVHWVTHSLEQLAPDKIIGVIGPDMPDLAQAMEPHPYVIQEQQKGTGDAVRAALAELIDFDGDVLIALGDVPFLRASTFEKLIHASYSQSKKGGLSVLATRMADPTGYGRIIEDENNESILKKIVEEKDALSQEKRINLVNSGAFCADAKMLQKWVPQITANNAQSEYYITDLPQIAAKDNISTKIAICDDANEVSGINTRKDLAFLEGLFQAQAREEHMSKGVTLRDPATTFFSFDTQIAQDVEIGAHVIFGPGVKIGEQTQIHPFCHLEGVEIGRNGQIGPFARLRPGSVLGDNTKIGNFVETKNARLGCGVKANHLSYIGDATLGDDVNFSAGAITVNYDGFEKHHTSIGKNVMVGCNANLVAPVEIGDGAYIAAGSTITEDVPKDALSVARNRPIIRDQWAARQRTGRGKVKKEK